MKLEGEAFRLFIGGSTAGNACSMQGVSLKIKFSNYLLMAVLQAVPAVCRRIKNGNRFLPASCVGQYKKK